MQMEFLRQIVLGLIQEITIKCLWTCHQRLRQRSRMRDTQVLAGSLAGYLACQFANLLTKQ